MAVGLMDYVRAVAPLVAAAVVFYFLVEQLSYHRKKGVLPGPSFVVPFLGSIVPMIDPAISLLYMSSQTNLKCRKWSTPLYSY